MQENKYLAFKDANICLVEGLSQEIERLQKRIYISHLSDSMGRTYCRSLRDLCLYTHNIPEALELDEIIDYLLYLKEKGLSWAKVKLDVAALRYYFREILDNE